ncbi:D-hexose-6-phosphate mutarotase [Geofilum sp. OHC36d9]|uniref:D-hexose-6-phosphate mutarotase n=1 Tax=Geofilum sp. OHC36d9 TaxID=3458413 RepID=UPI0040348EB7
MTLQELNNQFSISETIVFEEENGLKVAAIANHYATAIISLYGGQILSFKPHDKKEVLFVSSLSDFEEGKAIRGGIPLCFPWFGTQQDAPSHPKHGLARLMNWTVKSAEQLVDGASRLVLSLTDNAQSRQWWPYAFGTEIEFIIGKELTVKWHIQNNDNKPFTFTSALHSYFNIGDINKIKVTGLENVPYLEEIRSEEPFAGELHAITIEREVDRIYSDTEASCTIIDETLQRQISINKNGSRSTVVWNPWSEVAAGMPDLGNQDYLHFICVETANVLHNAITLEPASLFVMSLRITAQ